MTRPALLALLCVAIAACTPRHRPVLQRRTWAAALAVADQAALAGRYSAADSILAHFAATHPASPDTLDALFWRAYYMVDPANPTPSAPATAVALLDRYLAAQGHEEPRYAAEMLRRLAALRAAPAPIRRDTVLALDSAALRTAVARELEARERQRVEEIERLRDSLARTSAELERIRRRLAPQRP